VDDQSITTGGNKLDAKKPRTTLCTLLMQEEIRHENVDGRRNFETKTSARLKDKIYNADKCILASSTITAMAVNGTSNEMN